MRIKILNPLKITKKRVFFLKLKKPSQSNSRHYREKRVGIFDLKEPKGLISQQFEYTGNAGKFQE